MHLMFMDDLKVYSESAARELEMPVRRVEEVSRALGVELGLLKCAVVHISRGRLQE